TLFRRRLSDNWEELLAREILAQHVAEQSPLRDRVVQGHMCVGQVIKPALWHTRFCYAVETYLHQCHCVGLYIEGKKRKRALARKPIKVIRNKHEIEGGEIADEYGGPGETFQPSHILRHDHFRRLSISPAGPPGVLLAFPPCHRHRITGSS